MDFFSLLREHACLRTEAPAVSSPRRSMTYRKLWSRIERATARLQCEWGVSRDDTVAYLGNSHPDSLVLYFSLARCGACLLPLSPVQSDFERTLLIEQFQCRLLIVDDDLATEPGSAVRILSSLIATPCPHQPEGLVEDMAHPALLCDSVTKPASMQFVSLAELRNEGGTFVRASQPAKVSITSLFERETFSRFVLPVLQNGDCLILP